MAIDHAYFSDCFFFPADAAVAAAAVLSLLLLLSLALTGGKRSPGDVFDVLLRHSTAQHTCKLTVHRKRAAVPAD